MNMVTKSIRVTRSSVDEQPGYRQERGRKKEIHGAIQVDLILLGGKLSPREHWIKHCSFVCSLRLSKYRWCDPFRSGLWPICHLIGKLATYSFLIEGYTAGLLTTRGRKARSITRRWHTKVVINIWKHFGPIAIIRVPIPSVDQTEKFSKSRSILTLKS